MGRLRRSKTAVAAVALAALSSPVAAADDDPAQPPSQPGQQHNVTYRARVDGLARGALVSYRISDTQINSADPTMLPGRTFEATGVLSDPKEAGMRISIQWPYSANLHCEILVDDQMVAQADQFIGPRLLPADKDPDYGAINCGAPLSNAMGSAPAPAPPAGPAPGPAPGPELPPPQDGPPPAPDVPAADLNAPSQPG